MPNLNQQDEQMRADFESAVKEEFNCSEHAFNRTPEGYYNSVYSKTYGGRVQPGYAPVAMLWDLWQAARRQHGSAPAKQDLRGMSISGAGGNYPIPGSQHGSAAQAVYLVQHKQASGKECRDWTEVPAASFDVYSGDGFNTRILYAAPPVADTEQIKTHEQRLREHGYVSESHNCDLYRAEIAELRALSRRPAAAPEDAQQQDSGSCVAALRAAPASQLDANDTAYGPVHVVADLVRNLRTLDQDAPIYSAFHMDFQGERRCRTRPISTSWERVLDGKWVESGRKDLPRAVVVWAKPEADEQTSIAGAAKGGMELLPLPEPEIDGYCGEGVFTADQMHAYARAHLSAARQGKDSERLDWLEHMSNQPGGLLLHDGSESTGRCGLGMRALGRSLREAIDYCNPAKSDQEVRAAIDAAKAKGGAQ